MWQLWVDLMLWYLLATAGVRSSELRRLILSNLSGLGVKLDQDKNEICLSRDGVISADDSPVSVLCLRQTKLKKCCGSVVSLIKKN